MSDGARGDPRQSLIPCDWSIRVYAPFTIILSVQFPLVKSSSKRFLPILSFQMKSPMGVMVRQIKQLLEDDLEIPGKILYLYLVFPEFTNIYQNHRKCGRLKNIFYIQEFTPCTRQVGGKERISESEFFWGGKVIPAFWQRLDLVKFE